MSVIYKYKENGNEKIILMCKGADNVISDRLSKTSKDSDAFKTNKAFVEEVADEGLRTLFLSEKILDQKTFDEWFDRKKKALNEINDRDAKVAKVDEEIEKEMTIVGTSAIEDKLQD